MGETTCRAALELLGAYTLEEEGADEHDRTGRAFFTLLSFTRAEGLHLTVGDTDYEVGAGQIVLLPPGVPVRRRAVRDAAVILQFAAPGLPEEVRVLTAAESLPLLPGVAEVRRVWRERGAGYRYRALSLFAGLLAGLPAPAPQYSPVVEAALAYLAAHYTDPACTVAGLAGALGVSGAYLRRVFAREVGLPPKQYLSDLRFARAASLLTSGLVSVAEAAEASGFHPGANFSAAFRLRCGHAPTGQFTKSVFS